MLEHQMDFEILVRFLLAALWGGIVGIEREYRSKSAGFRTMIMISLGSCFFTMMSEFMGTAASYDRIAANIVTGIGFLGAGVIFRSDTRVSGITTAATIWTVAAVGMGIGAGHYFASAFGSLLIIIVLAILPIAETTIEKFNKKYIYVLHVDFSVDKRLSFEKKFREYHLKTRLIKEIKEGNSLWLQIDAAGSLQNQDNITRVLECDPEIKKFERY
jgi:putative Mg2+ transporter-C (MgtC) family protein